MSRVMRVMLIVVVLLLLAVMPVAGQTVPDVTPTAEVVGRAGTVFVDPVFDESNVPDEAVPYNEMLDDIALMMTALVDDIGDMVIPAQAQVIDDAPPVVVTNDDMIILQTFGIVIVAVIGFIAMLLQGKDASKAQERLADKVTSPTPVDGLELARERLNPHTKQLADIGLLVIEGWTKATPWVGDDKFGEAAADIRDGVDGDENPVPDGNTEKN